MESRMTDVFTDTDSIMYCCGKCKALFIDLKVLLEHKKVCSGVAPLGAHVAVPVDDIHRAHIKNNQEIEPTVAENTDIADTNGQPKRKRGRPRKNSSKCGQKTLYVEMVELPSGVNEDAVSREIDISQTRKSSTPTSKNSAEDGAENLIVLSNGDSKCVESVEITVASGEQDEDYSESEGTLDHESNLERKKSRYIPRCGAPKSGEYTITRVRGKELFLCKFCDYKSKHFHMLGRHLSAHNDNGEPFICNICSFQTLFRGRFQAHQKKHERPYKCDLCNYRTSNVRDLNRHNLRHQDYRPHQCDKCGKRFRQLESLTIHERVHTGELFRCEIDSCRFQTPNPQTLRYHLQRRHRADELEVFVCGCGYRSNSKATFQYHQKTHLGLKDQKCPYCSYTAIKASEVKRHMKRHLGENLYQCNQCKYKTAHDSALKNHLLKHVNVKKRFSCSHCGYKNAVKARIARHMESQHPNKPLAVIEDFSPIQDIDLESFKIKDCEVSVDKVIKLKYGMEEKEAITIDDNEGISTISFVKGLVVVDSTETGKEVGTFQCAHCRFKCFSSAALASHNIQYHESDLVGERQEIIIDSGMVAALASVQAQMDVETS